LNGIQFIGRVIRSEILRKIRKSDKKNLLTWVSLCQMPRVNSEKVALIEYTIGVLLSIDYEKKPKRKISPKFIKRIFSEAYMDFENYVENLNQSELQRHFPLGFMGIRGDAFPWQFAQAANDRYGPHQKWMNKHLGFTISDAIYFAKMITNFFMKKSLESGPPEFPPYTKNEYYNRKHVMVPGREAFLFWKQNISITIDKLKSLFPKNKNERLDNFLQKMSLDLETVRPNITAPLDFNILYAKPFVKIQKDLFVPIPRLVWNSIATTFHYDFLQDNNYKGKYIDQKGKVAEKRMQFCFSKIFPKNHLLPRVRYGKDKGYPDVDLIIDDPDTTMFVECSAKWITKKAKKGDTLSIITDLKTSIEKCNNQLTRALRAHKEKKISGITANKIIPIIVIDDVIPGIDYILKVYGFSPDPYPYIINIFDLDIIADLTNKQEFIDFITKRMELSKQKRIFAADETDYFVLYKLHGFEKYFNLLKKGDSNLFYIGHLESIAPTYYKDHLSQFVNDPFLSKAMKRMDLETGWS